MRRFSDSIKDTIYGEQISNNLWRDNNGQLICENVILARTGYYDYRESELIEDGSPDKIVKVYRSPEEVFDPISMKSMNYKPLVDDHPEENVTPETVGYLQKGFMTNIRRGVGEFDGCLMADIVVTDPVVIDEILTKKKRDLSVGYTADIEEVNGQYIMKNIRGNHIALCEAGRAGVARIRDSIDVKDTKTDYTIGDSAIVDFDAKGSFNNIGELRSYYPGASVEARGKDVIVRLLSGTKLLYSYLNGSDGKLLFVRKVNDSIRDGVEVLGDSHKLRVGQRVRYFDTPCIITSIVPNINSGEFLVEFGTGDQVCGRLSYDEVVTNINRGKIKLLDSVVFDCDSGEFKFEATDADDYATTGAGKLVANAMNELGIVSKKDLLARKQEVIAKMQSMSGGYGRMQLGWFVENYANRVLKDCDTSEDYSDSFNDNYADCFIDAKYKKGDKVRAREGGTTEIIENIIEETTAGHDRSGSKVIKYLMRSGRKYLAEDLEGGAWTKVSDSADSLRSFRVRVGDRKFDTQAHSAAEAMAKVRAAVKDAIPMSMNFAGKNIPKASGDYYWMKFGRNGVLQYHPKRNSGQVTTSHPYDETEYHWATSTDGRSWRIIYKGSTVGSMYGDAEAVLVELERRDKEKKLKRTGGIY